MAGIKDYSTTQANNTSLNGINTAEGMLPSDLNNAIRALMKNTREWYNDAQWVIYGDGDGAFVSAYASASSFTINGVDVTAFYHTGRRVKIVGSSTGTVFGTISSSSFSTNTTVNVTLDSGTLQSETLVIYLAILTQTGNSIPTNVIGADNLKSNAVTAAKFADDSVTNAKIADNAVQAAQINANAVTEAKINAGAVTNTKIGADAVNGDKIADDSIDSEHLVDGSIDTAHIGDNQVTLAKIADATIVTNSEQSGHTPDDNTFYTTSAADTRFLNKDTSELINSGQSWTSNDNFIATTGAIDARVVDLVDDVGGFVPIANETSFPNTNPDVNNGVGTIVSVQALASSHTANSSGVVTISNGTVGNSTVTLNNCGANASLPAGFGILVESTTTLHTYNFHRLVPKATEVTTVAAKATQIGLLGTADAVSDMNTLGTAQTVSDMNTLAGISGLNSLASNSANVTTAVNNLSSINNFAEVYRIGSSNPTSSNNAGDLFFNTSTNTLLVFNASSGIFQNAGSSVNGTQARFKYTASGGQTTFSGNDDNGQSLLYDANFADVFLNGSKLVNGTDVNVSTGNSVVLTVAAQAGDIIDIVGTGTFSVSSIPATAITSGTLPVVRGGTGLSTLGSANQVLKVNSSSNGLEYATIPGFGGILATSGGGTGLSSLGSPGQALVVNSSGNALEYSNASSAEIYGFVLTDTDGDGVLDTLQVTTTNGGADDIDAATYASFDDVIYASTGFSWSLNSNGNLIATI
tara:strand:+ start:16607 stop:18862 length:2256 start_codon:yes stop_codon:yes gene_type:complete